MLAAQVKIWATTTGTTTAHARRAAATHRYEGYEDGYEAGYDAACLGTQDEPFEEDAESYDAWYAGHYDQQEWDDSEA